MDANRKTAPPEKVGTLGKTASINQTKHILNIPQNQHTSKTKSPWHPTGLWIAYMLVRMACWEMLLAALAVFFGGGLVHV